MEKALKINKEHLDRFVNRELKRQLDIIKIVFGCILIFFVILGVMTKVYFIPLIALVLLGLVYLYVSAIFKGDLKALSTAFTFTINDNSISRKVDWSQLNLFMKLRAERAKHRYGSSLDQVIEFANVAEISVGVNGIKITSDNANILNGNGIINLPPELASYEEILDYFKVHSLLRSRISGIFN